jgi:membrane protein
MKKRIERIKQFLSVDIWTMNEDELSPLKLRTIRFFQFLSLAVAGFKEDKLNLRASALTYFTMLSIVPLLAMGFGIAKGFGLEAVLEKELAKNLSAQKEALDYILGFVRSMLETTQGGLIAGIGLLVLLWSVMKLMGNIEASFNQVWEVSKSRSIYRKVTDYLSIVIVGTLLMILSGSISIFISTELRSIADGSVLSVFSPLALQFGRILPYLITWFLFSLLYIVMPHTKVKPKSAIIAGMITALMFHLFQIGYVYLQSSATRYNAIYGSFAALPLFLIWLQITWFVLLLGVEISFAVQNLRLKGNAFEHKKFSIFYEKQVAVWIAKLLIDRFEKGLDPYTVKDLAAQTETPIYTVEAIMEKMRKVKLVSKLESDEEACYQPARSSADLKIHTIIEQYESLGEDLSNRVSNKAFQKLKKHFDRLYTLQKDSEYNLLLKDIDLEQNN